jgi:hypothetical protein
MKREEMVCEKCVNYENDNCRLNPEPIPIKKLVEKYPDSHLIGPHNHWCSQGQWPGYELYGEGCGCAAVG